MIPGNGKVLLKIFQNIAFKICGHYTDALRLLKLFSGRKTISRAIIFCYAIVDLVKPFYNLNGCHIYCHVTRNIPILKTTRTVLPIKKLTNLN